MNLHLRKEHSQSINLIHLHKMEESQLNRDNRQKDVQDFVVLNFTKNFLMWGRSKLYRESK